MRLEMPTPLPVRVAEARSAYAGTSVRFSDRNVLSFV
jgi:hypothetical protein